MFALIGLGVNVGVSRGQIICIHLYPGKTLFLEFLSNQLLPLNYADKSLNSLFLIQFNVSSLIALFNFEGKIIQKPHYSKVTS